VRGGCGERRDGEDDDEGERFAGKEGGGEERDGDDEGERRGGQHNRTCDSVTYRIGLYVSM
jgi:hypothetical protein